MNFRKVLFIFLLVFFCSSGFAFTEENAKTLVIYYSRTGNTKKVAEKLAKQFSADTERLIDKRKRTGPIGYIRASKDALAKNLTEIEPLKSDPDDYSIILIGTPSWYSNMTPAVRTFIAENDLSDKFVAAFGTANKTGVKNACKQILDAVYSPDREQDLSLPLVKSDLEEEILSQKVETFYKKVLQEYR